jgi:hypothetical protein
MSQPLLNKKRGRQLQREINREFFEIIFAEPLGTAVLAYTCAYAKNACKGSGVYHKLL